MKNKLFKTTIITLMIIFIMQISIFASELTLNIKLNKEEVKQGDKIKVTVEWTEGMQAADFYLNYDADKLKFIEADIEDDYINSEEKGQVKTAWFSMDNNDKTKIEYTFKAKKSGTVEFSTKINGGFATGELKIPEKYNEGSLKIEIAKQPLIIRILKILLIAIVIIVVVRVITSKNKKGSKKGNVNKYFK